jgi:colanic acid biosynthesis glycosyl transferase WcaI
MEYDSVGESGRSVADQREEESVLFVSQQFPPDRSGHASRMAETTTALAADGWDVTVLAPPPCFPHGEFDRSWRRIERTDYDGVTVVWLWAWQPSSPDPGFLSRIAYYLLFALHATLWALVNRRKFDAIVTTTPPISTGLAGFAFWGRPWIIDVRDLWIDASISLGFLPEGGFLERASRFFQRRALHTADRIAVTTRTLGDRLCEKYGRGLSTKVLHVPNGVDIRNFSSRTDGGDPVSVELERTEAEPLRVDEPTDGLSGELIYTGNIGHAQNLDTCVRALQYLPEDVTLRLVGGGDAVPDLEALAESLALSQRVTFVEPVPQEAIPQLLDEADVGLAPLKNDPEFAYAMPTKVYEYLGSELPVVVTGCGEIEHFVEESGGGVHAEVDPESIADAVAALLRDEEFRLRCGRRGREYVEQQYDRRNITRRFSGHLSELVERGE